MINNILSEELENEIIENMEKNDFFLIFEHYVKKNNIQFNSKKTIAEQFSIFLKSKTNRSNILNFIINNNDLDEWSKKQYLKILEKVDYFYTKWNNAIFSSAVNNQNYKKPLEDILSEDTQELISKILIKKWNKKELISYSKNIDDNWKIKDINVFMEYFKLKIWNITSLYTNDLVDVNLYWLLEFLNIFSEVKFRHLNIDREFFEKISVLDIGKRFKFYDIMFLELKYFFIEKWKIITRRWILNENWDILNIENKFFVTKLYWEIDILWVKFLKVWDKNWVYSFFDIHSAPLIIKWKYVYEIKESKISFKWIKYYEINNWKIILDKPSLLDKLKNYTSFDLSNVEVEEIYE